MASTDVKRILIGTVGVAMVLILLIGAYNQGKLSCQQDVTMLLANTLKKRGGSMEGQLQASTEVERETLEPIPDLSLPESMKKKLEGRRKTSSSSNSQKGTATKKNADLFDLSGGDVKKANAVENSAASAKVEDIDAATMSKINANMYSRAAFNAIKRGQNRAPGEKHYVPVWITPVFHDAMELERLLLDLDNSGVAVGHFAFIQNGEDGPVSNLVNQLKNIPMGITIKHFPENIGFSGAINTGVRAGFEHLGKEAKWFFLCNADTEFWGTSLRDYTTRVNGEISNEYSTVGLFYGPRLDHFAFGVKGDVFKRIGYLDEVFFPGYMEDIDFRWRTRMGGFEQLITNAGFNHKKSVNIHRDPQYQQKLSRSSQGWEYGWMKWGRYNNAHLNDPHPPSGWKAPFNIDGIGLDFWVVDPAHRNCVQTGHGTYHKASSTCWYNGTVMLADPRMPKGVKLPIHLTQPMGTGR